MPHCISPMDISCKLYFCISPMDISCKCISPIDISCKWGDSSEREFLLNTNANANANANGLRVSVGESLLNDIKLCWSREEFPLANL